MRSLLRWGFRWLFRLLILAVVLAVAALLCKDILLKALVEHRIHSQTGLEVSIRRFETSLLSPGLTIEGFKLYNPPDYGGALFLSIPELYLEYDPKAAAVGLIHVKKARFNLGELNVVCNRAGQTNLLAILNRSQAGGAPGGASHSSQPSVQFGGIDQLYLTLGTVRLLDLRDPTKNREFAIGWKDQEVKNLKTIEDVNTWASGVMLKVALQQFLKGADRKPTAAPTP